VEGKCYGLISTIILALSGKPEENQETLSKVVQADILTSVRNVQTVIQTSARTVSANIQTSARIAQLTFKPQ
jgi:hypothetical protein